MHRAFDVLGKRWTGPLVLALLAGPAGFRDLQRHLAISDSVLAARLTELSHTGLVDRRVEPGPPVRVTYALTAAGHALRPAIEALAGWADDHLSDVTTGTSVPGRLGPP